MPNSDPNLHGIQCVCVCYLLLFMYSACSEGTTLVVHDGGLLMSLQYDDMPI